MCRLAGYFIPKKNKKRLDHAKRVVMDLLYLQEGGGSDATGMGMIVNSKSFCILKHPVPANEFINMEVTKKTLETYNPRAIIAHCRLKTLGDQSNNMNNHPNYTKSGILTIHNGVITNHEDLFKTHGLTRDAEVDSEIVGKLIEKFLMDGKTTIEAIQETSKLVRGSMALAILRTKEPDNLYLVRRENNLFVAYDRDEDVVFFATQESALEDALFKTESFMGFFHRPTNTSKILIKEVPIGHGLKITPDGITVFKVESPAWQYQQTTPAYNQLWCKEHGCYWSNPGCKHTNRSDVENKNFELGKIDEELEDSKISDLFDPTKPIKKPSRCTSAEIEARIAVLEDKDYYGPLSVKDTQEITRLLNTLEARKILSKKTLPLLESGRGEVN